jgi:phosphoribosylformylglycinamidine synthase
MVILPGGFSGGDEPDGSAKLIVAFLRNPAVAEALTELLDDRDGLVLGICNGFQALIKLGLLPYGRIRPQGPDSPTLTTNRIGRHVSRLVCTRVASTLSPWFSACRVGETHAVAVSHGEGRFVASDEQYANLAAAGQVCAQYAVPAGGPTMAEPWNPNGSVGAVEALCSPDGRVLGKMGHSERSGLHLYRNVAPGAHQPLFEGGVAYFA